MPNVIDNKNSTIRSVHITSPSNTSAINSGLSSYCLVVGAVSSTLSYASSSTILGQDVTGAMYSVSQCTLILQSFDISIIDTEQVNPYSAVIGSNTNALTIYGYNSDDNVHYGASRVIDVQRTEGYPVKECYTRTSSYTPIERTYQGYYPSILAGDTASLYTIPVAVGQAVGVEVMCVMKRAGSYMAVNFSKTYALFDCASGGTVGQVGSTVQDGSRPDTTNYIDFSTTTNGIIVEVVTNAANGFDLDVNYTIKTYTIKESIAGGS